MRRFLFKSILALRIIRAKMIQRFRNRFGLSPPFTPMKKVMMHLEEKAIDLRKLTALEVFGGHGTIHTKDYALQVGSLEIWEMNSAYETILRKNFPGSSVIITDSYRQIMNCARRFDLVVVDTPLAVHSGKYEHFQLFPELFSIVNPDAILILNVLTKVGKIEKFLLENFSFFEQGLFPEEHLNARAVFYQTEHPENISLQSMLKRYEQLSKEFGFHIAWHFFQRRRFHLYYLVMKVRKISNAA